MAAALPLVVLLGLILVGLLQARANTDEPAVLRYEAWQLMAGLLVLLVFVARMMLGTPLPHLGLKVVAFVLVLALALVLLLRRRRQASGPDF